MTDSAVPSPPAWVRKRDGRLVPFDADKISRSLFAAAEDLGRPDAFLARELTDGVVHFLPDETEGTSPTTDQIADLVAKVVRELGHPALARAYAEHARRRTRGPAEKDRARAGRPAEVVVRLAPGESPASVVAACLRQYTLRNVFTRDLTAARDDGFLTLAGLEAPLELAGRVLDLTGAATLLERLLEARQHTGEFVALDGIEHFLARSGASADVLAADFVRELLLGLAATGLRAVVNLNAAAAPPWADDLADGPLFTGRRPAADATRLAALADALLEALARDIPPRAGPRVDWHLGERDFAPASGERLARAARLAAENEGVAIVFDRPRRPVALAEGLDRRHAAALLVVGLHLPRLAGQPDLKASPDLFVQKLGSLARLALSAAAQKREFLRTRAADRPALGRGFLLERARLVVAPVGLEAAVRSLTGRGLCDGKAPELARRIVSRLRDVLRQDGRACLIDAAVDGPGGFAFERSANESVPSEGVAGLTAWDAAASVKAQLRASGVLHGPAEGGTAAVLLAEDRAPGAGQAAEWLRWARAQTDAVRVRFVRPPRASGQLSLPNAEAARV